MLGFEFDMHLFYGNILFGEQKGQKLLRFVFKSKKRYIDDIK